jgi:hypothetical protein
VPFRVNLLVQECKVWVAVFAVTQLLQKRRTTTSNKLGCLFGTFQHFSVRVLGGCVWVVKWIGDVILLLWRRSFPLGEVQN